MKQQNGRSRLAGTKLELTRKGSAFVYLRARTTAVLIAEEAALGSIFINYRRNDSEGEAGRLFDELINRFGERSVFMDVSAIEPGQDFRKAIDLSVSTCTVLLAVIGQDWIHSKDVSGQRRLEDPADFVRIELASALRREIAVVPVLVRGAKMPVARDLPADLRDLAYRNAVELTHARWKSDIQLLIRALQPSMGSPAKLPAPEIAPSVPLPSTQTIALQSFSSEPPASGLAIDPEGVGRVRRELAHYIGPIADVVVKRAAGRSSSLQELCRAVAAEIQTDSAREQFLRWSRGLSA